ncbi:AMP-binding protein, partial [Planctomycetota bacterium]
RLAEPPEECSLGREPQVRLANKYQPRSGDIMKPSADRLPDILLRAAKDTPSAAMVHVRTDGTEVRKTYGELQADAERVLRGYRAAGLQPGTKVAILLSRSLDFFPAFWGSVLGGLVPVPLAMPAAVTGRLFAVDDVRRLRRILTLLDNPPVVVRRGTQDLLKEALGGATGSAPVLLTAEDLLFDGSLLSAPSPEGAEHASSGQRPGYQPPRVL